jgi:hypothetical protein
MNKIEFKLPKAKQIEKIVNQMRKKSAELKKCLKEDGITSVTITINKDDKKIKGQK